MPERAAESPDWLQVARLCLASRRLDEIEERVLYPARQIHYQFSARGHELGQVLLGLELTDPHDGLTVYYRSRPLLLALGLDLEEAAASALAREGGVSHGRDIGVVFNRPGRGGASVLPASGGVGAQYTPAAGWAQAIRYRSVVLGEDSWARSIAVVHAGDASVATGGFWSALTLATTLRLPLLFYIEDNGYGISVASTLQTPGGNIAANLRSFGGLELREGDGTDPLEAAALVAGAVRYVRTERAPLLLRLQVPRLSGHSGQDTQAYKAAATLAAERARDPLPRLQGLLVPRHLAPDDWAALDAAAEAQVAAAVAAAQRRPEPDGTDVARYVFCEARADGRPELQEQGGLAPEGSESPRGSAEARPQGPRINMLTAIRRTLDAELGANPRVLVFGEDVGAKGGVHGATVGLQAQHGTERVFDTSLSEEGILGRAVGMALAGLLPVPEIQFRKYADPATEQFNDCGTLRWRTRNRFAAPLVLRVPGGFLRCGDPWHSQTNEVQWIHAIGWRVVMPSNAEDAAGLLRAALRGNDPTVFFEHRALLDAPWARRPWPGDDFVLPFGRARRVLAGDEVTVVSWGAMVERCEAAARTSAVEVDLIDLRTLVPWDRETVLESVRRTGRCLVVHEDTLTAGFGAEVVAVVARSAFADLEAPLERLGMADVPSPHHPALLDAALPGTRRITDAIQDLASA